MRHAFHFSLILLIACGPFFYEAPPSLSHYPERVAVKRWQHLFAEISPRDPALPDEKSMAESCQNLADNLKSLDTTNRLAEIDRLLVVNRSGNYSSSRANFLHELREICAEPQLFDAAKSYLAWRTNPENAPPTMPPMARPWDMKEEEFKKLHHIYQTTIKGALANIEKQSVAATPSLRPYWIVRKAAYFYDLRRYADAEKQFAAVTCGFPDHPRAEAAGLMQARCKIEQSRQQVNDHPNNKNNPPEQIPFQLLSDAEELLHAYILRHPKGRFTPDAEGWLGAIALDREQFGTAVRQQLIRMDRQTTREITRSALRECDFIFNKLLELTRDVNNTKRLNKDEHFDAEAVAKHPEVARLFVHHCIDPAADVTLPLWWDSGENGGRATINFLNRRIFKPSPFLHLALKELGKELLTKEAKPDATTLILLAWSASEDGENEQALALLDAIKDTTPSDENLHARAIIMQRLNRHADAVKAFDSLEKEFPNSPLTEDIIYRRSVSLFKSDNTSKAIADIAQSLYAKPIKTESGANSPPPKTSIYPSFQMIQWLDTLIQFSPIEQLEAALAIVPPQSQSSELLRQVIRTRALTIKRFDLAAKHLSEDSDVHVTEWEWPVPDLADKRKMTRTTWDLLAAPLAESYAKLASAGNDAEKAKLHLTLARQWMDNRGTLTMPGNAICYYAESEKEKINLLRRKNAIELGFKREDVNRELDRRDEATHALEHALEAAKNGDISIAAPALELANYVLFRRSELSLYHKSRAVESGDSILSADIHQQLLNRFPTSPEAARSIYLTFIPTGGSWMPGDYHSYKAAAALMGALSEQPENQIPEDKDIENAIAALTLRFEKINPKTPLSEVLLELAAAKLELDKLRPQTEAAYQNCVISAIDRLDDLKSAASLANITTRDFSDYANGRIQKLPSAFASLLDFRDRLKPKTEGTESGAKNDTIDGWNQFLLTYPDSPKAEAASFRLTRLIARNFRSQQKIAAFPFPQAPIPSGYKRVKITRIDPAHNPDAVLTAIANHEKRFPMGRYLDDLNLLKAGALIDAGNFKQALELLAAILENPVQKDLHVIAALEFADICQRLLLPDQRAPVAAALRSSPNDLKRLWRLVNGDTFLSRLQPLMSWLENPA